MKKKNKIKNKLNKLIITLISILVIFALIILFFITKYEKDEKACQEKLKAFCESQFLTYEKNGDCTQVLIGNYKQTFHWECIGKNKYKMKGVYISEVG